jgi:hypothetical protein
MSKRVAREKVTLPGQAAGNGTEAESVARSAGSEPAPIDLRPLAARAEAGDPAAAEAVRRVIMELRAKTTMTPAKPADELDPDWRDQVLSLTEQVRRAVPEEWTEEELQEQIALAIAEVRASRAGNH